MDIDTITNFITGEDELINEILISKIEKILTLSLDEQEISLTSFFKENFPDISINSFFEKHFPKKKAPSVRVSIIKSFEKKPQKRTIQDFVKHFNLRFKFLEQLLKSRSELSSLTSISRLKSKKPKERVSVIGMISEINLTKNGHYILLVEDLSGTTKVLIHKNNAELVIEAESLVLDEVIGIVGSTGNDIVFSETIIHPDIPLSKELKKSPYDNYALFFGDIHYGSKEFLKKEFIRMLSWINGKTGTMDQRKIAKKVKYIFLTGDVVEGVGIYPSQENDLEILDIRSQYDSFAKYLEKIPSHIKIIICPGNHDVGRIAEPQLPIDKDYAKAIWALPNVIMVSNPAYISVDVSDDFPGIDVLMYHGYSLIHYADQVPVLRNHGGQKVADEIMEFLLKRRHLAPTHGSALYIPDVVEDGLLIDPIPDIFVTGHIHRAQSRVYRNITCINSSGWTAITDDQEKRGLEPQPGRIFVVSLKTREVKILNFSTTKDVGSVVERKRLQAQSRAKVKS